MRSLKGVGDKEDGLMAEFVHRKVIVNNVKAR
jgi:hypothetical protein